MPSLTDKSQNKLKVPNEDAKKITGIPMLVRLRSNNKAEVIVKIKARTGNDATHVMYDIEWTPSGAV